MFVNTNCSNKSVAFCFFMNTTSFKKSVRYYIIYACKLNSLFIDVFVLLYFLHPSIVRLSGYSWLSNPILHCLWGCASIHEYSCLRLYYPSVVWIIMAWIQWDSSISFTESFLYYMYLDNNNV